MFDIQNEGEKYPSHKVNYPKTTTISDKKTNQLKLYFQKRVFARLIDGKYVIQVLAAVGDEAAKNGIHFGWVKDATSGLITDDIDLAVITNEDAADSIAKTLNEKITKNTKQ